VILLCGVPGEPPLELVAAALDRRHAYYHYFDQRQWASMSIQVDIVNGRVGGILRMPDGDLALDAVTGVFTRLMDDQRLPDLVDEDVGSARRTACRSLHQLLVTWQDLSPARVVNRSRPQASNGAKPLQSQIARSHGFSIPDTLVTNDPDEVLAFRDLHQRLIYKSTSGVRSIVRQFTDADLDRLPAVRWCAVQFQEFIPGGDVRVHVVGESVFATAVESNRTDYRYAERDGGSTVLTATQLDDDVAMRCVSLAQAMELPVAGIDLRFAPDGRVVCFEVNPSPAFSYYQTHTRQPISDAIAAYLCGQPG
jgi:glutathione synthase/RimK-type ligase-like ATP-grasp enzyme